MKYLTTVGIKALLQKVKEYIGAQIQKLIGEVPEGFGSLEKIVRAIKYSYGARETEVTAARRAFSVARETEITLEVANSALADIGDVVQVEILWPKECRPDWTDEQCIRNDRFFLRGRITDADGNSVTFIPDFSHVDDGGFTIPNEVNFGELCEGTKVRFIDNNLWQQELLAMSDAEIDIIAAEVLGE